MIDCPFQIFLIGKALLTQYLRKYFGKIIAFLK